MENMYLKSIDIHGFKSFANPTHIDFSAGINAVIAPATNGAEDLLSAIRWLFGMCDESEFADMDRTEVKASVVDENGKKIEIVRRANKESTKIDRSESSVKAISQFQKYLNIESDKCLAFGKTKIIATEDKKLAAKANRLIGIMTDEADSAKIYTVALVQEDFENS